MKDFIDEAAMAAEAATMSCFDVGREGEGFRITWGGDPLNFVVQTKDQLADLADKIGEALK